MSDDTLTTSSDLWSYAKKVFTKWEILRIPYNGVLLVALMAIVLTTTELSHGIQAYPFLLLYWLMYGVGANLCFFAAPMIETYVAWLGFRSRWITVGLFLGGIAISLPLVLVLTVGAGGFFFDPD